MSPGPTKNILIKADGSVEPADAPIERVGSVYSLTNNINFTSIKVSCNGIVLDGKGFLDMGYDGWDKAVILDNTVGCIVKNFIFFKFSSQVAIEGGANNIIYGNTFTGSCYGVEIYSQNCQIRQNNFISTTPGDCYGIEGECQTTLISNNTFTDLGASIQLTHSENNTIIHNKFADATSIMLYQECNNNIITKNTITGIGLSGTGIYLLGSNNNFIYENTIAGKAKNYQPTFENCFGVWIYGSSYNIVKCNNISGNLVGIQIGHEGYPEESPSSNNYFILNNIFDNKINEANVERTRYGIYPNNFWDNGTCGNYWSDYATRILGTPKVNEPQGTASYNITTNNIDQYPLLEIIATQNQPAPTSPTQTTPELSPNPLTTNYSTDSLAETSIQNSSSSEDDPIYDYIAIGSASVAAAGLAIIGACRKKLT
jgi:parallel beta-helix repeat protein